MHDPEITIDLRTVPATVELAVDDTERQLLTPVLRYFLALGYQTDRDDPGDHLRLRSGDDFIIVASALDDRGVVLSFTASALDQSQLRDAVTSAITHDGGLQAEHEDPNARARRFHDRSGVARAVLRA